MLSSKTYDRLKYVALIVLPALGVFYGLVGTTWEIPETDKVVITISGVTALLGALLQVQSAKFKAGGPDGYLSSTGTNEVGIPDLQLTITKDPSALLEKGQVNLKVGTPPNQG